MLGGGNKITDLRLANCVYDPVGSAHKAGKADGWRECREAAAGINEIVAEECDLAQNQLLGKASAKALRMAIRLIRKLEPPDA